MRVYGGINRHSDNSIVGLTGEEDKVLYRKRLPIDLSIIPEALDPCRNPLQRTRSKGVCGRDTVVELPEMGSLSPVERIPWDSSAQVSGMGL